MTKLVFGMNQSLDGYVDHMAFAPSPTLFRHFVEEAQGLAGSVYGRQMYEVMRYWDDDHPEWNAEERAFAAAWRNQPKWVVSRSLKSVGPNARLVENDLEGAIRELKAERAGEIEVAGPNLAQSLTELGLIDEYRIYLHPVVLGHGKPFRRSSGSKKWKTTRKTLDEKLRFTRVEGRRVYTHLVQEPTHPGPNPKEGWHVRTESHWNCSRAH